MSTRGWENATATDVRDRRQVVKPSKYRNVKTVVDGQTFDSKREAARYQELKALQHVGEIVDLQRQVPIQLYCPSIVDGSWSQVAEYVADFTYTARGGVKVVEDVKGKKTAMYQLKKKWLELQSGIQIREVR